MFNKRIQDEIKRFQDLKSNSIFIYPNNDVIYAMIIGNKDTIYAHGFYFFTITFPSDYPFSPPKVLYHSPDNLSRLNPHLFNNGYVCMSSLEKGNGWTPVLNFYTILQSIHSIILNNGSIDNEVRNNTEHRYFDYIQHQNIRFALIGNYLNTPHNFSWSKNIMKAYIKKYQKNIFNYINSLNTRIKTGTQCSYICPEIHERHTVTIDYRSILNAFTHRIAPTL